MSSESPKRLNRSKLTEGMSAEQDKAIQARSKKAKEAFSADQDQTRMEHRDVAEQLDAWLDAMNYALLDEILSSYARKSGVNADKLNVVSRESIFLTQNSIAGNGMMAYDLGSNAILVNASYFSAEISKGLEMARVEFLQSLIHEYVHAAGFAQYWQGFDSIANENSQLYRQAFDAQYGTASCANTTRTSATFRNSSVF